MSIRSVITVIGIIICNFLLAQNEPIVYQAEDGSVGEDFTETVDNGIIYITPSTDYAGASFPSTETKIVTFSFNFSDTGTYDLYVRVRVGPENYNDDSFYAGNGFGVKAVDNGSDWLLVNGIVEKGYSMGEDVVDGGGNTGSLAWKWINVSEFVDSESPVTFHVESTDSAYTFQYGARENGLDLDKIAFGKSELYYTVNNLGNEEPGSNKMPGGDTIPDSAYTSVQTYTNPILPGDHPDPTLLKVGEKFYHCVSSFHFTPYLSVLTSTDLVHWKEISRVVQPTWNALLDDSPKAGIWQGAITYFYGSYWIYFSNTAGGGQYFCKADNPEGPWSDPIKMNITETTEFSGYDNSVFVDEDGTPYLLIKPGRYINRIQEIGTDGHLTGDALNLDWVNSNGRYKWAEGPVMCKRDGWYYYFVAGNIAGGQWVLRSQTLTADSTKWEHLGSVFLTTSDPLAKLCSPNHMSAPVQLCDGTWWTIAHSYETNQGDDWNGQGRQGVLHQITWDHNGKPTASAPTSQPGLKPQLPQSGIAWKLPRSDYFDGESIDLSWHFLNTSAATKYSLTDREGWLSLDPGSNRAHILHKDGGHHYTLVTRVDFDATANSHAAGIYLTNGNESVNVRLYSGYNNGKKIVFVFGSTQYEVENTLGNDIWLKIEREGHNLSAFYSLDGLVWFPVGSTVSVYDLDKEQPEYNWWVGNSHGLFAEGAMAFFDLFLYKDGFSALPVAGYNNYYGVETDTKPEGKVVANSSDKGGWAMLGGVELGEGDKIPVEVELVASSTSGGTLEIWLDDLGPNGQKIATVPITSTGNEDTFKSFKSEVKGISGQHDIYILFKGEARSINLHTIRFSPDVSFIINGLSNTFEHIRYKVYPNPFNEYIKVEFESKEAIYSMYTLSGQKVLDGIIIQGQKINVAGLEHGVYMLQIGSENKSVNFQLGKY